MYNITYDVDVACFLFHCQSYSSYFSYNKFNSIEARMLTRNPYLGLVVFRCPGFVQIFRALQLCKISEQVQQSLVRSVRLLRGPHIQRGVGAEGRALQVRDGRLRGVSHTHSIVPVTVVYG